jgi:glycosyltransferase involved in cell wall biosynthesis
MTVPRSVLFIGTDVDSMGGSQRVIHTIAHGLAGRGHDVSVIGIRPADRPMEYFEDRKYRRDTLYRHVLRPTERRTTTDRLLLHGPFKCAVNKFLSKRAHARAEALLNEYTSAYMVIGSPRATDWVLAHNWQHLRTIGWYHESFEQARTTHNLELIDRHYPQLDRCLFLSDADTKLFQDCGLPNAVTMPNPVPFFPDTPAPLTRKRILAAGRFDPIKAFHRLIEAFHIAQKGLGATGQEWELQLVGDGPEHDNLLTYVAKHGLTHHVKFPGRSTDMITVYRQASILALSSEREGSPMTIAEAAACGLPTVAFDISAGVRNLITHEQTGLLVPPKDIHAMADALVRLMRNQELRRRIGAEARQRIQPFALPHILDRWEAMFDDIDR